MAAAKGVTIEGLEELEETLLVFAPREANALLRNVVEGIAKRVADRVASRAPVATGELRGAVFATKARTRRGKVAADVRIKDEGFHWRFQEYGTVKQRPRPFVVPAVEEERRNVPGEFKKGFGEEFEKALAKKARRRRR